MGNLVLMLRKGGKEEARELSIILFNLNYLKNPERNKQTQFRNTEKINKTNNSQKGPVNNELSHFLQ